MLYLAQNGRFQSLVAFLLPSLIMVVCLAAPVYAQSETLDENSSDPVKLFERGQSAHARGELLVALEFYEQALKLRPEFPEAEFQRANAMVSLKRFQEAERSFRVAIQLRNNWTLPQVNLGSLLIRLNREREAESIFRKVLIREPNNEIALTNLAGLRLRAGDSREALTLAVQSTNKKDATTSVWLVRAMAERALGAKAEAATSLNHVLANEPNNIAALLERAELNLDSANYEAAIKDLQAARELVPGVDKSISSRLAFAYEQIGNPTEARRAAEEAGLMTSTIASDTKGAMVIGSPEEIANANSEDPAIARIALLSLAEKNPKSAVLLARLGATFRTDDPARSLDYYRRASELQPNNPDYAIGYASALVQARRFADAAQILRIVLTSDPDNYAAHANLATALYALKNFPEALLEYRWIIKHKPELVVTFYLIATAHDNLGEYQEALSAYETFLSRADSTRNQLEIEKVKLRLPSLKRQIELGQGQKRKKNDNATKLRIRP